ncbi:HNH endonuclease [Mesorhizobium sp. 14Argb]
MITIGCVVFRPVFSGVCVGLNHSLPILDAAHIRSYADGGEHEGPNGLLLRTDIHKLFDLGYVTVDKDLRFVVSGRLKADFDNGRHYYDLHGTTLLLPILAFSLAFFQLAGVASP